MKKRMVAGWFVLFAFITVTGYAENDVLKSLPEIKDIEAVPEIKDIKAAPEIKDLKAVPEIEETEKEINFEAISLIERMENDEIVLNDSLYRFSPDVKFYSKTGKLVSRSKFHVGTRVGYILNPENIYEVISVWEVEK
ncbi:hypothetical protein [Desulfonema magnum]|uniref:Uncharacterized protein n=1 Tax=Desulfonema magnum TaxID=45655 RepID=A0A975BX64_9BACT|nr:hypothetical protein [Desulfonema magnum]QTA92784.1 Uncharacterized protein dnm_088740 [Desulfonema magnum]